MVSSISISQSQFNVSHLFANILFDLTHQNVPVRRYHSPGQSGPESNGNEGVLYIPQISKVGALPSDCLMSYPGHSLGDSYPSAEMQSVYSTAPADWAFMG